MVYVRKLLGGESSSVACEWADSGGEGKTCVPLTYASVTVKNPQREVVSGE